MKYLPNVNQNISYCCLDFLLHNKLGKVRGKSEALSLVERLRFSIRVWHRNLHSLCTKRINLTSLNNFNASKVYTTKKKQTKSSGLINHENFKQKTHVCSLYVCSEDHRYVQTGEKAHRVTNPGR